MKTLRLETTAPFQGLAELVAYDEGLFEKEDIQIEWMDREKGVDKSPQLHITDHKDASRYTSHGRMMEIRPGRPLQCLRMGQLLAR